MDRKKEIKVKFFQRKPIPSFHFSVENIFADLRRYLPDAVRSELHVVRYFSKGVINRLLIILEVFFAQGQINHFTGDILFAGILTKKKKNIQTILDLYFIHNSTGLRRVILKLIWLDLPIRRARYVTCISQATKEDILQLTNYDASRIFVIPIALGSVFKYEHRNYNYNRPTLLQIGSAPNKNVERIIEAVAGLTVQLIILGKHEEKYEKMLIKYNIDYKYISNLNSEEMKNLYKVVDILVFPSLFEGFGMPIIEAQAMGTPVLTSNLSSMPEVAGDGALLVNPYSVNDIKDGVLKLIEDSSYRSRLIENGFRNCQKFNSKEIANQYYELYKQF